jgi:IS30 family transposase
VKCNTCKPCKVSRCPPRPGSYQQLQPEDRVTMASLLQQNHSLRDIAAVLNRSPSTISRERHRNVAKVAGVSHQPVRTQVSTAQHKCQQRRRAGRPLTKLHHRPADVRGDASPSGSTLVT